MCRLVRFLVLALALTATTAVAQEPPDVHRLDELRFLRMREALALSEEQIQSLRSSLEDLRGRDRALRESQRESIERLREALRSDPVDEAAVARALESVEARRGEAEHLRAEHQRRMAEILGPEQRARFLLFNHHFDSRLRELIDRRRGVRPSPGRPGIPGPEQRRDWKGRDDGEGWLERRLQGLPPAERRQAIEHLRGELDRLEERLKNEGQGS